jgi:hypothetical protein
MTIRRPCWIIIDTAGGFNFPIGVYVDENEMRTILNGIQDDSGPYPRYKVETSTLFYPKGQVQEIF